MPLNLLKVYNQLLELMAMAPGVRTNSLLGVFNRDIRNNQNFRFRGKIINPTPGQEEHMDRLFRHLTTHVTDEITNHREYEPKRSERLHWVKGHVDETTGANLTPIVFSTEEQNAIRTYIFNPSENYLIVLEPFRDKTQYYILSAYYLDGRNPDKIKKKLKRKLPDVI